MLYFNENKLTYFFNDCSQITQRVVTPFPLQQPVL
jgi:hypothetical protein